MIMKLDLWSEHRQKGVLESFTELSDFLTESNDDLPQEI
jgi:hypothetical protein